VTLIAIPMKNRHDLTEAVLAQLEPDLDDDSSILVIDNGSDDLRSKAWLENVEDGERILVLRMPDAGIHEMWNAALDLGDAENHEHVVLLNNDLRLDRGPHGTGEFVRRLVEALDTDDRLWAVCPNYDGRTVHSPVAPAREICAGRYDGSGGFAGFAFALHLGRAKLHRRSGDVGYRFPTELKWWGGDNHLVATAWSEGGWVGIARDVTVEHLDGGSQTIDAREELKPQLQADIDAMLPMIDEIERQPVPAGSMSEAEFLFRLALELDSDIHGHLQFLCDLTCELEAATVIELGVRAGVSSCAFLFALEETGGMLWSVDPGDPPAHFTGGRWTFVKGRDDDLSVLAALPQHADVVFVDTDHTYELTRREIELYHHRCDVMVFHDTAVRQFPHHQAAGYRPQPDYPVRQAIHDLLVDELGVKVDYFTHCNGLAVAYVGASR
jgi:predicted O-methyltransferase YrrM